MIKGEKRRIEAKIREAEEDLRGFNEFWHGAKKEARRLLTDTMNSLMYNKKERDKGMRFVQQFFWVIKMFFVFFAIKGFTYWLTGR